MYNLSKVGSKELQPPPTCRPANPCTTSPRSALRSSPPPSTCRPANPCTTSPRSALRSSPKARAVFKMDYSLIPNIFKLTPSNFLLQHCSTARHSKANRHTDISSINRTMCMYRPFFSLAETPECWNRPFQGDKIFADNFSYYRQFS